MFRLLSLSFPIALLLFVVSCGPASETTIVDRGADAVQPPEGTSPPGRDNGSNVHVLRIGELDRIRSLDPLFAENNSNKRVIQLLYDGLVQFNENDEVEPAIARAWEVSDDSLTYTFNLRRNARFQDSNVFTNGIGRRITARDVRFVFERMAHKNVPPHAAGLFKPSVFGFEMFYREQRELYFEEDRLSEQVAGFKTPNDSTFVIELVEKDSYLLNKLSSPYASIYPREAVRENQNRLRSNPVGSGQYRFRRSFGDTLFVLERNPTHYTWQAATEHTGPDRLEILSITEERDLFRQLVLGRIDLISELGIQMMQVMISSEGDLVEAYQQNYDIVSSEDALVYKISYNPLNRFGITRNQAYALLASRQKEQVENALRVPVNRYTFHGENTSEESIERFGDYFPAGQTRQRLIMSYSSGSSSRVLGSTLLQLHNDQYSVAVSPFRVKNRETIYHLHRADGLVPEGSVSPLHDFETLLEIQLNRYLLKKQEIEYVKTNKSQWWLDVSNAKTPLITL